MKSADTDIQSLIDLISNTTDAYTTALFTAPAPGEPLALLAYQSLSRNIDLQVRIAAGEGLIGWAYKNEKPVTVDNFDHDTRRLFLYRADESIKSFMAVPLPKVPGVLAVDSKQRYVFTDKSQKILHQFADTVAMTIGRLKTAQLGMRRAGVLSFLKDLDQILLQQQPYDRTFAEATALVRAFAAADACFLTVVVPGDRDHFLVTAQASERDFQISKGLLPIQSGLAGWVIREKKALVLDKARLGTEKSYIFHPDEPLKNFSAFAGYPVMGGWRQHGALILSAESPLNLDEIKTAGLEMAASRLAAALETEFMIQRVAELNRLDPQVGLPHRTYFSVRLARLINGAVGKGTGVFLILLNISDSAAVALADGQGSSQDLLKQAARYCLSQVKPDTELGHLNYGIIAVAMAGRTQAEAQRIKDELVESLSDHLSQDFEGKVRIKIDAVMLEYPVHAKRAEDLIYQGLALFR